VPALAEICSNKANKCLTTNWDSAIDLRSAPKTKKQNNKKQKQKKHTNTAGERTF
jgi:hypothetical protein